MAQNYPVVDATISLGGDVLAGTARDIQTIKDDIQTIKDDIQTIKDNVHSIQEQNAKHAAEQKNIATRTTNHATSPMREGRFKLNPRKTVPGLGNILMNACRPANVAAPQLPPGPATNIGDPYPLVISSDLSHAKILELMLFYNEDFGIILADNIEERKRKFTMFMQDIDYGLR